MPRPQIAAVVTEYRHYSHAEHILDRFLWGYGWNGRHHHPPMDLVALYTDQVPKSDLSRSRAKLFPQMKIYPTIAEALTQGGDKLAVDGVLLIGEHGDYPHNEKGQHLYPRYEFFQKIVEVFRDSNRSVPVFNDKHLSWNWDWAKEMVETAKQLEFPLMAGSSLPFSRRIPSVDIPLGAEVEEIVSVSVGGGMDGYGIHALEAIQCLAERRRGGETGVVEVHVAIGEDVWPKLKAGSWDDGGFETELFEACLCRSHSLMPAEEGFNHVFPTTEQIPPLVKKPEKPICCRYRHADGLKVTMLFLEGLVHDFTFAARLKEQRNPLSLKFHLPPREVCNFFSPQTYHVEQLFLTGKTPCPIERNLLTTGLTAAGVESLWLGQKPIKTPHLAVRYEPRKESSYWKN